MLHTVQRSHDRGPTGGTPLRTPTRQPASAYPSPNLVLALSERFRPYALPSNDRPPQITTQSSVP